MNHCYYCEKEIPKDKSLCYDCWLELEREYIG